jgi:chromate transporter
MLTLSALYVRTSTLPTAISLFHGLQAIIVAIVGNATVSFGRTSLQHWQDVSIALVAAGMFGRGIHPIVVILLSACLGLVLSHRPQISDLTVDSVCHPRLARPLILLLALTVVGGLLLWLTDPRLFELAALMMRIDVFAFGGGFASVPLMFHEIVEVHSWMDRSTFLDGIALGQMTPGPIVITASFVGYLLYGWLGSLIATVSVFLPSFCMVVGMVPYFDRLRQSGAFHTAINGIFSAFVGLLLTVTVSFAGNVPWDIPRTLLASMAFIALLVKVDIMWVVLIGALISVFVV